MASLQNILSKVQRNINDEMFTKIRRGELVDIINDVILDISGTVRLWVETVKVIPYPAIEDFTVALEADLAALAPTAGQTALVTGTGERWRYYNAAWEIYPYNVAKIDPEVTRISTTLQVKRNGIVGVEVSYQAMLNAMQTGYLFNRHNDEQRTTDGSQFASLRRPDDGFDIHFLRDFSLGEEIHVTYRREQPYAPTFWLQAVEIPETVSDAVEWMATTKCFEKIYLRGDETVVNRLAYAKANAKEQENKADAYLRNLLDENSVIITRPIKWLPQTPKY